MTKNKNIFIIIDGNAIIHRAYHALPPLTVKDGTMVNAVYGFATMLLKVISELKPTYVAVTFDLEGPTFRHEAYKEYKATRVKADQELYDQIPLVKQLVEKFSIPIFEKKGFEADDVIGTIVQKLKKYDGEIYVVTGDMDTLQLVDDARRVQIYTLRRGMSDVVVFDEKKVRERYDGLGPDQLIDFKSLSGDQSDNIKGVKGVGEKTTIMLLKEFGSVEALYKALKKSEAHPAVSPVLRAKLLDGEKDAQLSRELAEIHRDVPIDFDFKQCAFKLEINDKLLEFLKKLEFYSLVNRLTKGNGVSQKIKKQVRYKMLAVQTIGKDITLTDAEKLLGKEKEWYVCALGNDVVGEPPSGFIVATTAFVLWFPWGAGAEKDRRGFVKLVEGCPVLVGHDLKQFFRAFLTVGGAYQGALFDIMIAAYLLAPGNRTYDAPTLVMQHRGVHLDGPSAQGSLFGDQVQPFAAELWEVGQLKDHFEKELRQTGMLKLFETMEMPLISILARLELNGVNIDTLKMESISRQVENAIEKVTRQIYNHAGEEFNISSSQQLRDILFDKLGISPFGVKKGKTGLSTAAPELEKLWEEHPIIPLISEYRELTKLKTTYIDVLPTLINKQTGRVHARFNQAVTATGRLSSSDPNLQNIPARTPLGKEIRDVFVAEKGNVLVVADYSQIELRVVAHLASDKRMIQIFERGEDIHRATAAAIHGVSLKDVTPELRRSAKEVNFGVLYGMGAHGLAQRTGLTRVQAAEFIEKYFKAFAGVKKYLDGIIVSARTDGYVETLYGRRRYIPEINASNFQLRSAGERMAVNLPVQGTAADIMKLAMIEIDRALEVEGLREDARLILQVHDEVVLEVVERQAERVAQLVKQAMERVADLDVPIEAQVGVGKRWGEIH